MSNRKRDKTKTVTDTTQSITRTDLSTAAGDLGDKIEVLLGDKDLPASPHTMALVRRFANECNPEFYDKLGIERPSKYTFNEKSVIVLGPVPLELVHSLATLGVLGARESVLVSHDRWKEVQQIFPDLRGLLLDREEHTNTDTHTETEALFGNDESISWESENTGILELDKDLSQGSTLKENLKNEEKKSSVVQSQSKVNKKSTRKNSSKSELENYSWVPRHWFPILASVVVIASTLYWVHKQNNSKPPLPRNQSATEDVRLELKKKYIENLPEDLKPLPTEFLYQNEFGIMRKLRPILTQYEKGSLLLDETNEQFLKTISQPASSSFQARVIAANQLALYYVNRGRFSEAQKLLQDILLAAPTDLDTLINASIFEIIVNHPDRARSYAVSAQRLCRALDCWLPYTLLGYIEALSQNYSQSDRLFQIALSHMENTIVYGMWMKANGQNTDESRRRLSTLVRQSLWADPDRLEDSPLRAPLFIHWLYTESYEGYLSALAIFEKDIGLNKAQYLRWIASRHPYNSTPEPISQVHQALSKESDLLGQLLYAYVLKEERELDQASQIVNGVITQLSPKDYRGNWPWLLAGSLAEERGLVDQSILYYQGALSRQSRDVNAVYGLAMNLIYKKDFHGAQEKIAETLRLDPSFIPAILRITRMDWHARNQQIQN
jgi:hypothetical protein